MNERPSVYELRARAIKMSNFVERELQRQRNKILNGIPVTERLEVLFHSGSREIRQIRTKLTE
jgi:hypothetical protein